MTEIGMVRQVGKKHVHHAPSQGARPQCHPKFLGPLRVPKRFYQIWYDNTRGTGACRILGGQPDPIPKERAQRPQNGLT